MAMLAGISFMSGSSLARAQTSPLIATADGGCICHAPLIVGVAKGIFAKYGINVQIARPATGIQAIAAVQSGDAQDGAAAPVVVAQLNAKATPVKGLFMAFGDATGRLATDRFLAIVARASSGVREGHLEDLKGKKVGVPIGTIAHQYLYYALAAKRVDAIKDVTVQRVLPPDMANALSTGAVDAIVIWEPVASRLLQTVSDAVLVYRGGNHIQFLDMRTELPSYVAANRLTVKNYVTAFSEAAQYTRTHLDETADILAADFSKPLTKEQIRPLLGLLSFDPRISRATQQNAMQGFEFAVTIGALPSAPSFLDVFDPTVLTEVLREHPEFFNDLPAIPKDLSL